MSSDKGGFPEAPTVTRAKLSEPAADGASVYTLLVIEGADRDRSFQVDSSLPSRALVGKSPACDVRLTDAEVSRRHAALELVGRRLRITDLGSTNGTFVDGVAI